MIQPRRRPVPSTSKSKPSSAQGVRKRKVAGGRRSTVSRKRASTSAGKSGKKLPAGPSARRTNLLVRDIDADVLAVLRERAKRSGRSLQQELHAALLRGAHRNFDEARAMVEAWHERLSGRDLPDSTDLIREDRQR